MTSYPPSTTNTFSVESILSAIKAGNSNLIKKLLANATSKDWTGVDAGMVLVSLVGSGLPAAHKSEFAKLIVSSGELSGGALGYTLNSLIHDGNFTAATNILSAASSKELGSISANDYGNALVDTVGSNKTDAEEAALAKLIVTKGELSGGALGYALTSFVDDGNFTAATNILNAASSKELSTISMNDYGNALVATLDDNGKTDAQKAAIAKLIVSSGELSGGALGYALTSFIHDGNFTAATNILNAASSKELRSISANDYGNALVDTVGSNRTDAEEAALANLIVSKGELSGGALGYALTSFIQDGNFTAATNILNAASTKELSSISAQDYGNALVDTLSDDKTDTEEAALAKLIVSSGELSGGALGYALTSFIHDGNFAAATNILNAASSKELGSISAQDYGNALVDTLSDDKTDAEEAALAKLIVSSGELSGGAIGYALTSFVDDGNFTAATNILNAASTKELRSISANDYGNALVEAVNSNKSDATEAAFAKLIVSSGELSGGALGYALTSFVHDGNFTAATNILNAASAKELGSIGKEVYEELERSGIKSGNDTLTGTDDHDILYGFKGNDKISGGNGNDILFGGDGNDVLFGDAGNDVFYVASREDGMDKDTVNGGTGRDTLVLDFAFKDAVVDFEQNNATVDFLVKSNFGIVTVKDVETVQFSDRTFAVSDLLHIAPQSTTDNVHV